MYLMDHLTKITSEDLIFLNKFSEFNNLIKYDLYDSEPKTREEFFIRIYKKLNIRKIFNYMISNLNLIELLDNISMYNLFENLDFTKNNKEDQKYMIKLIHKLPQDLIENQLQNSKILDFFFEENYNYCPWTSFYFVKTLAETGLDLNKLSFSVFGKTFINEDKLNNWKRIIPCTKLVYFLIENNYNFKYININTHLNLYLKKMIVNYQIKESCYRADNLLGIMKIKESLKQDGLENIFKQ